LVVLWRGATVVIDKKCFDPNPTQLLAIIRTQTEIAKLGLDLNGVMEMVAQQAQAITGAAGAVVELAEGDDMVYRAVAGIAQGQLAFGQEWQPFWALRRNRQCPPL
jgi:hypothetical protein